MIQISCSLLAATLSFLWGCNWMFIRCIYQGCTNPWRQSALATNSMKWYLMFWGPQGGTCFMSSVWAPRFLSLLLEFWGV